MTHEEAMEFAKKHNLAFLEVRPSITASKCISSYVYDSLYDRPPTSGASRGGAGRRVFLFDRSIPLGALPSLACFVLGDRFFLF